MSTPRDGKWVGIAAIVSALTIGGSLVWWSHHHEQQQKPRQLLSSSKSANLKSIANANDLMAGSKYATLAIPMEVAEPSEGVPANSGFGMISGSKSIGRPIFNVRPAAEFAEPQPQLLYEIQEPEDSPPPLLQPNR